MTELILFIVSLIIGEVFRPKPGGLEETEQYDGPTSSEIRPVPYLFGTAAMRTPNMLWQGDNGWRHLSKKIKSGLVGTHKYIYAYTYYVGMHLGLCVNEVDALVAIWAGDGFKAPCYSTGPTVDGGMFLTAIYAGAENNLSWKWYPSVTTAPAWVSITDFQKGRADQPVHWYLDAVTKAGYCPGYRNVSALVGIGFGHTYQPNIPFGCGSTSPSQYGAGITQPALGDDFKNAPSGAIGTSNVPPPLTIVCKYHPKALGLLPGGTPAHSSFGELDPALDLGGIAIQNTQTSSVSVGGTLASYPPSSYANKWFLVVSSPGVSTYYFAIATLEPNIYPVNSIIYSDGILWRKLAGGTMPTADKIGDITLSNAPGTSPALVSASSDNVGKWYTITANVYESIMFAVQNQDIPYLASDFYSTGDVIVSSGRGLWVKYKPLTSSNPMEVLYEMLTNKLYGLGIDAEFIDATNFQEIAAVLWAEGVGIAGVIDQQMTGREFVNMVMKYIDGVFYVDVQTGKFKVKLARFDYTVTGLRAAGKVFNKTNIRDFGSYTKNPVNETVNEIKVEFVDALAGYLKTIATAQDGPNIAVQGKIVSQTMQFPFFSSRDLAASAAGRNLRAYSASMARGSFTTDRTVYEVEPGDVWLLDWEPLDIVGLPIRIATRKEGEPLSGTIEIEFAEDVFGTGTVLTRFGTGSDTPVDNTPRPVLVRDLVAAPFQTYRDSDQRPVYLAGKPAAQSASFVAHHKLAADASYVNSEPCPGYNPTGVTVFDYSKSAGLSLETDSAARDARSPDTTITTILTIGDLSQVFTAAFDAADIAQGSGIALLKSASTYEYVGYEAVTASDGVISISLLGGGKGGIAFVLLGDSAVAETWTFVYAGAGLFTVTGSVSGAQTALSVGRDYVLTGLLTCQIYNGTTAFSVGNTVTVVVDPAQEGRAQITGVWRGLRNTVPQDHPAGTRVWINPDMNGSDDIAADTAAIEAKYTDVAAGGTYPLALVPDAHEMALTFASDSKKPYPPANTRVKIEPGGSYGTWAAAFYGNGSAADMDIAWTHRDRLNQTTEIKQDDAVTAIETGCTYTLKFYSGDTTSGPWTLERTYSSLTGLQQTYPQADMIADYATMVGGVSVFPKDYKVEMTTTRTSDGLVSTQTQTRVYECAGADYLADYYAD